jgi:excisionase family DNA binding protein
MKRSSSVKSSEPQKLSGESNMQRYRGRSLQHSLKMLTVEEAAKELLISVRHIRALIRTERLVCFRLGNSGETTRIIRCQLTAYAMRNPRQLRWLQFISNRQDVMTTL